MGWCQPSRARFTSFTQKECIGPLVLALVAILLNAAHKTVTWSAMTFCCSPMPQAVAVTAARHCLELERHCDHFIRGHMPGKWLLQFDFISSSSIKPACIILEHTRLEALKIIIWQSCLRTRRRQIWSWGSLKASECASFQPDKQRSF